jgi:hypothetical protein
MGQLFSSLFGAGLGWIPLIVAGVLIGSALLSAFCSSLRRL